MFVECDVTCWLFLYIYGSVVLPVLMPINIGNPYRLSNCSVSITLIYKSLKLVEAFCTSGPNLVIFAWMGDDFSYGHARDWHMDTQNTQADAGNDNTQRPKLSSCKNWMQGYEIISGHSYIWLLFHSLGKINQNVNSLGHIIFISPLTQWYIQ